MADDADADDVPGSDTVALPQAPADAAKGKIPNFVRSAMLGIDELEPHPDALAFWAAHREQDLDEDHAALFHSIREHGILEPLAVIRKNPKDEREGYWIIDGCSRFHAADKLAKTEVPCSVYDVSADDICGYVYQRNAIRHRISTGERVMRYLDLHQKAVLEAWEEGKEHSNKGYRKNSESRDTDFSSFEISVRLGVSKKDILKGIELLASKVHNGLPKTDTKGKTVIIPVENRDVLEKLHRCYGDVLAGKTPIRRWQAAFAGRKATEDVERNETDYSRVARRSLVGLANAFENWGDWNLGEPDESDYKAKVILPLWLDLAAATPPELMRHAMKVWQSAADRVNGKRGKK